LSREYALEATTQCSVDRKLIAFIVINTLQIRLTVNSFRLIDFDLELYLEQSNK